MKSTKLKTKTEKGITLIALIITIVVLMILAAVAINSITNDGILGQAEGAANKYTEAQNEEQKMLDYYELVISQKAWTQNGTTVSRNGQTLNVGDEIVIVTGTNTSTPYTANNIEEWRVLGVEYGKLLLISESNVDNVTLDKADGYLNGVKYLDDACNNYDDSVYAVENSARSVRIEDINRITGYVPDNTPRTYTFTSNFVQPDGRAASETNPITESDNSYTYNLQEYIDEESNAYKMILRTRYLLANQARALDYTEFLGCCYGFMGVGLMYDGEIGWCGAESQLYTARKFTYGYSSYN